MRLMRVAAPVPEPKDGETETLVAAQRPLARIFHGLLCDTVTVCALCSNIRAKIQNREAVLF